MKSPAPPESGSPAPEERRESEAPPTAKPQMQKESEKDSGYSDSSSESLSSEETSATVAVAGSSRGSASTQTGHAPIYIVQSVLLKQPRLLVLQPPIRRHRKRPASYLPILRSYPRIAPRLAPPPAPSPTPSPPPPSLLEVSLRAFSLLRRSRETQRSVRELRAHVRLYERALRGEPEGWQQLKSAMERSGGYRKATPTGEGPSEETATSSDSGNQGGAEPQGHAHPGGAIGRACDIIRQREPRRGLTMTSPESMTSSDSGKQGGARP